MRTRLPSSPDISRTSLAAHMVAIGTLALALVAVAVEALAHHPGSHARREGNIVVIEAVAITHDSCTRAIGITAGAPAGETPAPGRLNATLRLERPADAVCATVIGKADVKGAIPASVNVDIVHLYIVGPDGKLASTERVPIR